MSIILSNKRLSYRIVSQKEVNLDKETTYRDIIKLIDINLLRNSYNDIENEFSKCEEYVKTWLSYQVLWDIQPKTIYDKLGDDMEKWQQLMTELKEERKTFDNSESEKNFGVICIYYSAVQSKVNNK